MIFKYLKKSSYDVQGYGKLYSFNESDFGKKVEVDSIAGSTMLGKSTFFEYVGESKEKKKEEPKKDEFDLDGDGKVTPKDRRIAARLLGSSRGKKAKKGKK